MHREVGRRIGMIERFCGQLCGMRSSVDHRIIGAWGRSKLEFEGHFTVGYADRIAVSRTADPSQNWSGHLGSFWRRFCGPMCVPQNRYVDSIYVVDPSSSNSNLEDHFAVWFPIVDLTRRGIFGKFLARFYFNKRLKFVVLEGESNCFEQE